ncbi:unnamed protein product [Chrysodeixis includens]|uniref:SCP domain-containing protein n=1 Tax=Chrysodeixis includens TaxID=689277 RepID=A0A9N8Q093_CHRIL|nr:unnamed protein product [Chrysodeixis includens]
MTLSRKSKYGTLYGHIPGPSPSCKSYDNSAVLRNYDITELVNKINERRNFVALGHSKILPQAANMKKIHWSSELAFFAQRWVDQCVSSIHPEEEDLCRDLGKYYTLSSDVYCWV